MHFCGREAELGKLIEAWTAVSDLANPGPKVAIIQAEQGIGKTRLALEFYRWLSTQHDPNNYWPDEPGRDGNNLLLNPQARACD